MNKNAIQFIESCLNMNIFYKFLYYFLSFGGTALYHFGSAAASAADGGVDIPRGFAQVDMIQGSTSETKEMIQKFVENVHV